MSRRFVACQQPRKLHASNDDREQVVEVVGHAARQLTKRLEPLRASELAFALLEPRLHLFAQRDLVMQPEPLELASMARALHQDLCEQTPQYQHDDLQCVVHELLVAAAGLEGGQQLACPPNGRARMDSAVLDLIAGRGPIVLARRKAHEGSAVGQPDRHLVVLLRVGDHVHGARCVLGVEIPHVLGQQHRIAFVAVTVLAQSLPVLMVDPAGDGKQRAGPHDAELPAIRGPGAGRAGRS